MMDDIFPNARKIDVEAELKKGPIDRRVFYSAFKDMKDKCYNPFHPKYPQYGGAGIHVCHRWLVDMDNFCYDMFPKILGWGLHRLNKEDHFHPGNCFWEKAKPKPQNHLFLERKYKFTIDWLAEFEDWEKFMFVYKRVLAFKIPADNIILAKKYITYLYNDPRFSILYDQWVASGKDKDKLPSIDHMTPVSRGGTNNLWNLNWVTCFENILKRDRTQEEWDHVKNNFDEYFL